MLYPVRRYFGGNLSYSPVVKYGYPRINANGSNRDAYYNRFWPQEVLSFFRTFIRGWLPGLKCRRLPGLLRPRNPAPAAPRSRRSARTCSSKACPWKKKAPALEAGGFGTKRRLKE